MIKINLLPPELQKRKAQARKAGGFASAAPTQGTFAALALALLFVFVVIDGYTAYHLYSNVSTARAAAGKAKSDLAKAKKSYDEQHKAHEEKFREWNLMHEKEEILSVLMPKDRIVWAEKLNMLSDLIPDGVYITGVEVTEKVDKIPTEEWLKVHAEWQKKKDAAAAKKTATATVGAPQEQLGPEPPKVVKPIITQTLILNALALWGEGDMAQLDKVVEFQKMMQAYETQNDKGDVRRFRDGFDQEKDGKLKIQPGLQEKKVIDEVPVWQFQLTLATRPFIPATTAPAGAVPASAVPASATPAGK